MATRIEEILKETRSLSKDTQRRLAALIEVQALSEELQSVIQQAAKDAATRRHTMHEILDETWLSDYEEGEPFNKPDHWRIPRRSRRVH